MVQGVQGGAGGSCGDPGRGMDKGLWGLGVGVHRPGLLVGSTVKWWGLGGPIRPTWVWTRRDRAALTGSGWSPQLCPPASPTTALELLLEPRTRENFPGVPIFKSMRNACHFSCLLPEYIANFPKNSPACVFRLCKTGCSQISWQTDAGPAPRRRATPGPSVCTAEPRQLPRDANLGGKRRIRPTRLPHGLAHVPAKLRVGGHVPWSWVTWNSCGITVAKCVCTSYFLISC